MWLKLHWKVGENRTIARWRYWTTTARIHFGFVLFLNLQSRWGLQNNSLNLQKKTTNSRILVVVVKWRHRSIVLLVRPQKQSQGAFRHNLDQILSATRRLRLIGSRSNHVQMHNAFLNNAFLQFLFYNNQEPCSCNNLAVMFLQQSSLRMTRWLSPWVLFLFETVFQFLDLSTYVSNCSGKRCICGYSLIVFP